MYINIKYQNSNYLTFNKIRFIICWYNKLIEDQTKRWDDWYSQIFGNKWTIIERVTIISIW